MPTVVEIPSPLASVSVEGDSLVIRPRGWHRVGAITRRLEIPLAAIREARWAPDSLKQEFGIRPLSAFRTGSTIPGVYRAGTFKPFRHGPGRPSSWWLVRHPGSVLELTLDGAKVDRVLLEVRDPATAAQTIHDLIDGRKTW